MDVNGNDNSPEWGYCTETGCQEAALPIWLSGGFPDDPDLFLCIEHIGAKIRTQQEHIAALAAEIDRMERNAATVDRILAGGQLAFRSSADVARARALLAAWEGK